MQLFILYWVILTFWASIELHSHCNVSVPSPWMNPYITRYYTREQAILNNGILVSVSCKILNNNNKKTILNEKLVKRDITIRLNQDNDITNSQYWFTELIQCNRHFHFTLLTSLKVKSYLSRAVLLVFSKENVILTGGQIVLSHPLTGILSSLSSDLHHSHRTAKINREPLVPIVVTYAPCAHPGTWSLEKESSVARSVIFVPAGWSGDLRGSYASISHS